jgi:hypothetical protein
METTQLTIQLPKTEVSFLEEYTRRHKISIADLIDTYIKQLQEAENTVSSGIDAELEQHTGIIPDDIDVEHEYYEHIEGKHQ